MKTILTKHKVLLIALCGVLCLGILSGLVLTGVIRLSKEGKTFATVAEAKEAANAENADAENDPVIELNDPVPTPTPIPNEPLKLSADEIRRITDTVEMRRRTIIPVQSNQWVSDNRFLWTECEPSADQIDLARQAAKEYTEILFGKSFSELTGYPVDEAIVSMYSDNDGIRGTILRVTDPEGKYIVIVSESDWGLICADLFAYPTALTIDREKDALQIAERLGYSAKSIGRVTGERLNNGTYILEADSGKCLSFSYYGDQLYQAAIYPNRQAENENEYFLADIQWNETDPAYPENFVEAEPLKTSEQNPVLNERKIFASLSRTYKNLSGEELDTSKLTAKFYRDESGAREDCWKITGEGFDIVISAYSGNVISFEGAIPCKDLLTIPYEEMGGEEYEAATKIIAEKLVFSLGAFVGDAEEKTAAEIDVNAVYDGNYCTMDIVLKDGTWYECYYEGGVLKEIWYYADEHMFMEMPRGWVANGVYVHPYTGKLYIPEYRDWDGDLHVKPRPEN